MAAAQSLACTCELDHMPQQPLQGAVTANCHQQSTMPQPRMHGPSPCHISHLSPPALPRPLRDPYIIGGQFIWGCSLNDYQGCLQDAKQGDNTRHCKWDDKASLCIIDPVYTQSLLIDR